MSEAIIQQTTVEMIRKLYPELLINLSLSGIKLNGTYIENAKTMKALVPQGFEKGLPDLSIYLPDSIVLNLEFKTNIGKQSPEQVLIQSKLTKLGHNYHLVRTPYEVFDLITQYTELTYRVQCMSEIVIPSNSTKLTEQFLHFPKGTKLAEAYKLLCNLYHI